MAKYVRDLKVLTNKELQLNFFKITVDIGNLEIDLSPGQFMQLRIDGSNKTFLRRPVSVHDYNRNTGEIDLLVHVIGEGTRYLSRLLPGDFINAVFPLGNTFTIDNQNERVILIGGGCGVAPLLFLGRKLYEAGIKVDFLLGFRSKSTIIDISDFKKFGDIHITTEDGSVGEKGYLTSHTILKDKRHQRIYCCGPDNMMRAVAKYALVNETECEVSLENLMACGFGACLCCIVPTDNGNVCTCTEGPVFNIKELKW